MILSDFLFLTFLYENKNSEVFDFLWHVLNFDSMFINLFMRAAELSNFDYKKVLFEC